MFNLILYVSCGVVLVLGWMTDRSKTKAALIKAWRSFDSILPEMLVVLMLISIILAYLDAETIGRILGDQSGWLGVVGSALVGAVTLIPGFVAFPTAALLLQNGVGLMQVGAFVSTLMMVGVVTLPMEMKYFGKKMTLFRNLMAFGFSFLVAWAIGGVVK